MIKQHQLSVRTGGRGFIELSDQLARWVNQQTVADGLVNVFVAHTSASLLLCENADPTVLSDLADYMERVVIDGDHRYRHNYEGDDDMAAHIRSVLTTNSVSIPVSQGQLQLGTWQGLFLWEHRYDPNQRKVLFTLNS